MVGHEGISNPPIGIMRAPSVAASHRAAQLVATGAHTLATAQHLPHAARKKSGLSFERPLSKLNRVAFR